MINIGDKFNKWVVQEFSHKNKNHNSLFKCICECGTVSIVQDSHLKCNRSKQCKSCAAKISGRKGLNAMVRQHLYMIGCGEYIKIGSTDHLKQRITNLHHANPYPINVLYEGIDEGYMEPTYHEIFKEYRIHGEWFCIPTKELND